MHELNTHELGTHKCHGSPLDPKEGQSRHESHIHDRQWIDRCLMVQDALFREEPKRVEPEVAACQVAHRQKLGQRELVSVSSKSISC